MSPATFWGCWTSRPVARPAQYFLLHVLEPWGDR